MAGVGTPVKLLYEGLGHTVTVEIKTGEVYRGVLENAEDNMNCLLQAVTLTHRDGRVVSLEQVYIRGSQTDAKGEHAGAGSGWCAVEGKTAARAEKPKAAESPEEERRAAWSRACGFLGIAVFFLCLSLCAICSRYR